MKQIRLISAILLTALTLSFFACGNDDESDNFNYQETMAKYENATFEYTTESSEVLTLTIFEMYELNGESLLSVQHSSFDGRAYIWYDKINKGFYLNTLQPSGGSSDYPVKFVDINTINIGNYADYIRK